MKQLKMPAGTDLPFLYSQIPVSRNRQIACNCHPAGWAAQGEAAAMYP